MTQKLTFTIFLLTACLTLLVVNCSRQSIKSFSELTVLRNVLAEHFQDQSIKVVSHNANMVGVEFINASLNHLDNREMMRKAQATALLVKNRYPAMGRINLIAVYYVDEQAQSALSNQRNVLATYLFNRSEDFLTAELIGDEQRSVRAESAYNRLRNETTVQVSVRLEGDPNEGQGFMLTPVFTITGNEITEPQTVELKFSSYSNKEEFSRNRKVTIGYDEKKIISNKAQLIASNAGDNGIYSEFISLSIPYRQFVDIAESREARMNVGEKRVALTKESLLALKSMKECVMHKSCR